MPVETARSCSGGFVSRRVVLRSTKGNSADDTLQKLQHIPEIDASKSGLQHARGLLACAAATRVDLSENRLTDGLPSPPAYVGVGAWEPRPADDAELAGLWGAVEEQETATTTTTTTRRLWPRLSVFEARKNRLRRVPGSFFPHCAFLRRLDLSANALTDLPPSFACMKSLEEANVSSNSLISLERFRALPSLRVIHARHNKIRHLNAVPPSLPCLEVIDLSFNPLESLVGFQGCSRLRTCLLQSTSVARIRDAVSLDTCPNLHVLDLRRAPLAGDSPETSAEYRLRVLHALPALERLDGVAVTSADRVKAADAHGEWEDGRAAGHGILLHDRPYRSRQQLLETMGGEPTLMLRRGAKQGGVFLVLEVWDSEGPSGGLRIKAYLPGRAATGASLRVTADEYQETFDAVASALRADGAKAAGPGAEAVVPTAVQVVEALLHRVRAHFRAGDGKAPPTLWLSPVDGPIRKALKIKRTVRTDGNGTAIVEVTPAGAATYAISVYVPATSTRLAIEASPAQTAVLVGGDTANPDLATERRREIMEALADAVRIEHFGGKDRLSLEPAGDSLCL